MRPLPRPAVLRATALTGFARVRSQHIVIALALSRPLSSLKEMEVLSLSFSSPPMSAVGVLRPFM